MLAHRKDNTTSWLASIMLQEGERGLASVAPCFPGHVIAAGYWHSCEEPLRMYPCVFLLNTREKTITDPFLADKNNITYYVAGSLGKECTRKTLMQGLCDLANDMKQQGFMVEPVNPILRCLL